MKFEIRPATAADERFLREMLYLAIYVPAGQSPLPPTVLEEPGIARYVTGWGNREGDVGLIALVDGEPVGAAWMRRFSAADPGYGFVDESTPELTVAIAPLHRGNGIGSLMIKRLFAETSKMSLSCDPENPAWRLYVRLGFEALADGRTMVRNNATR